MFISVLDNDMLDGPQGCKGEREIGMRAKRLLGVFELEGLKVVCAWNHPGESLCNRGANRSTAET